MNFYGMNQNKRDASIADELAYYCHSMYIEILYDYDTVFSKTSLILDYCYRVAVDHT